MYAEEEQSPVTLSEIYNQPRSSKATVERALDRLRLFSQFFPLDQYSDIIITGCGSSHNLAACASFAWSEMLNRPVAAVPSSELLHFPDHYLGLAARPLVIAISRSGGTTEVRLAVERLKRDYRARALAITGEQNGSVARVCDAELAFDECYERSVVMTQAFTSMLVGLYLLADGASGSRRYGEIAQLPELINRSLRSSEEVFRALAERYATGRFFFLGSGPMKGLADECALKLTEMALDTALSHRTLEFRHGPKATLVETDQVIIFPVRAERQHAQTLLAEIGATGAATLVVSSDDDAPVSTKEARTERFLLPGDAVADMFLPALYAHTGQLLAYWRAAGRDLNPDAPPHLARTVLLDV
jgi:glucosamine--fructose-6-phosphate aminotransferase (isomerizing)